MNINWKQRASDLGGAVLLAGAVAAMTAALPARAQGARVLPADLTNIAAAANGGRVLSATSTLDNDATFKSDNLIDGQAYNPATKAGSAGWSSNKFDPVNMDYVTIGFAGNEIKSIGKLVFNAATSLNPERWAKDIEVQVSTTSAEGPYRAIQQITLKRTADAQEFPILSADARFVRLMFRSNWGSDRAVSLGEVEIYEAIDTTNPMGGVIARLESTIADLKRYKTTQAEIQNSLVTRAGTTAPRPKAGVKPVAFDPKNLRPVQAAAPTNGNLALAKNGGKIVDVTSIFDNDEKFAAANLIDGQNYSPVDDKGSFGWSSQGFVPGRQYVTIGFRDDRSHVINKVVINPVSNQSSLRWASRVEVQVTMGGPKDGPFRTVGTFNIRQQAVNQDFTMRPVEAKFVRFVFTANGPGNPLPLGDPNVTSDRAVSLGEIEIYEQPATTGDLEALIGRFEGVLNDLKTLRPRAATADVEAPAEAVAAPANAVAPKAAPKAAPFKPVAAKTPARRTAPKAAPRVSKTSR